MMDLLGILILGLFVFLPAYLIFDYNGKYSTLIGIVALIVLFSFKLLMDWF